jgi:hypothetical protein
MTTDSSVEWMKVYYGHVWQTTNSAHDLSREYLGALYMPTHSRFGPFAVGGLLACNIYTALHDTLPISSTLRSVISFIMRWLFTGIAMIFLVLPCLPAPPLGEPPSNSCFSHSCHSRGDSNRNTIHHDCRISHSSCHSIFLSSLSFASSFIASLFTSPSHFSPLPPSFQVSGLSLLLLLSHSLPLADGNDFEPKVQKHDRIISSLCCDHSRASS